MLNASETLESSRLEMRWRILSLAADFDRIDRAGGGKEIPGADAYVGRLREALKIVLEPAPGRAERVQMLFSDKSA